MATVIERVDRLEEALENFITSVGIEFNRAYNAQVRTEGNRRVFRKEKRRQPREMNRRWGDLANKLGTMAEDLVAPSLPRLIQETLGLEVIDLSVRRKRKLPDGRVQEFDALAVTESLVCLNSTKATLRSADVEGLTGEIDILREFFPEYRATPVVGILASLAVDDGVLRQATREGFLVLATGDQLMEVKNPPGFVPRRW